MAIWHSFLPFGLSIAICVFVSWKSVENQLELRADSADSAGARQRGTGEEEEGEDDIGEAFAAAAATAPQTQLRLRRLRPPRTASEFRARLQTLSRMAPGPLRLARGRALALAAERALRETSPGGGVGGAEEGDDCCGDPAVVVESHAAAALRQTLPWLDARLAALAIEDARAEACGPCEICAGFDGARATHAWPCGGGGQRRVEGGSGGEAQGQGGGGSGTGLGGGLGGLLAALFGNNNAPSSSSSSPKDSDSVYTTSRHRACGRCSAKCGARCPWCRREEGPPRLAFLECAAAAAAS